MRKCKHPEWARMRRVWLRTVTGGHAWFAHSERDPEPHLIQCGRCAALLPLGPARITPDVAIELRAAEIAANVIEHDIWWLGRGVTDEEFRGYHCAESSMKLSDEWHAGYLARCIVENGDE